jgi:hypothetical protein
LARKFLYFVAICIVLAIVALLALRIWSKELTELAFVPTTEFVEQKPLDANAYQDPAMWFSRPGIGLDDPARWQPATRGEERTIPSLSDGSGTPEFATFFVHPTSYLERAQWNGSLDDETSQDLARLYIKGMASPFNRASEIWAPKYRQAAFGAFLSDGDDADKAIDAAYADVKKAFEFFIATVDDDTPIVLAGHSQGALHLLRLLREEVAGKPVADRVAAAYVVGWPISIEHDLPSLGFPACANEGQSGCIMSWSSYAEPADPSAVLETYANSTGFDGHLRGDSVILCTNPLTGGVGGKAPASSNLGTLVPDGSLANGELVPSAVPARCDERGLLLIGDPPEMGNAVLPGNNYHVYDIPLFWANIQRGVVERVRAWQAQP